MVAVAQLVRALDCGSGGRAFEPRLPPQFNKGAEKLKSNFSAFFLRILLVITSNIRSAYSSAFFTILPKLS